ncbi:hypothetical protein [Glutamicibacter ardleyensis]|uniref:hypothetical protein n=1 Tax=Glutamicibacter ardleyensis TaxID=225894 RepID=UPI003FD2EE2E
MAVYNGYKGANTCTKGPADGAKGAMAWFLAKYKELGGRNSGIYNCRNVRGSSRTTSLHGEGRAVDFGLKWYDKISVFEEFAEQLRLNSAELGIQCIIFNRKIFSGGYASKGWHRYGGVNPHTDHLHVELSWGAANRDLEDTIALWERELGGAGNVKPVGNKTKPKPSVAKQPTDYKDLKITGKLDKPTIEALQIVLRAIDLYNREVDGGLKYYTIVGLQKWMRAVGEYPSKKFKIDGKAQRETWKAVQRFLRRKGFYPASKWIIDGKPESATISGLQRYLNTQNGK